MQTPFFPCSLLEIDSHCLHQAESGRANFHFIWSVSFNLLSGDCDCDLTMRVLYATWNVKLDEFYNGRDKGQLKD